MNSFVTSLDYASLIIMINVSESFYSIQGEGIFTGVPAIFLRLMGCNLTCGGVNTIKSGKCDTKAKWRCDTIEVWTTGKKVSFEDLCNHWETLGWINVLERGAHLIITGGEPLLQSHALSDFLYFFRQKYAFIPFIELETNGTLITPRKLHTCIRHYNVSFKTSNSGMPITRCLQNKAATFFASLSNCTYKFVVSSKHDIQEIFDTYIDSLKLTLAQVCFMPGADSRLSLQKLEPKLIEWCKNIGVRYSTRLHIAVWNQKTGV